MIQGIGKVAFTLLLAGCSSNGGGQEESDDLIGSFQVRLVSQAAQTYTSVVGMVFDGPTPNPVVLEEAAKSGDCRLLTPRVPYCEEPCGAAASCVEDATCQAFPNAVSVGTVYAEGLRTTTGETGFSMDPIANNYQAPSSVTLEYPAFSEGDQVTLAAEGEGAVPAFLLSAHGISPLEVLNDSFELADGQALDLTWTPPGQSGDARIHVKLDISHHGGSKGQIECDSADDGSLELSADLIDQLKALGISGFPTIVVRRRTAGSAKIPAGRIELAIDSKLELEVIIPGLVSCWEDADCPNGQTCQDDRRCK